MHRFFALIKGEKGNAMVLSVLVLLTLTSIGIVSVQRTNSELLVAGNVTRSAQASSGSEAGANHSLVLLPQNSQVLVGTMIEKRVQALDGISDSTPICEGGPPTEGKQFTIYCRSSAIPDPEGAGKSQTYPIVDRDNIISRGYQSLAQSVSVVTLGETKGRVGEDVDGNFCYLIFDFNAKGGIPSKQEEMVEDSLCLDSNVPCVKDTVIVENRIRALVGPRPCLGK